MKFEVGKFYNHPGGRQIAIVGEVETTKWGKMLVLEEVDATGHAISCTEIAEVVKAGANGWIEIGKEEWMRNFDDSTCPHCGKVFVAGSKFVPTEDGPFHVWCYGQWLEMHGPSRIITKENMH